MGGAHMSINDESLIQRIKNKYLPLLQGHVEEYFIINPSKNNYLLRIMKTGLEYREKKELSYSTLKCDFESNLIIFNNHSISDGTKRFQDVLKKVFKDLKSKDAKIMKRER
jgi:hypothetical protein